ncbi:MAG: PilX N-terminal domain-containing pilus assembly protein [Pseudomonadota bacterium]
MKIASAVQKQAGVALVVTLLFLLVLSLLSIVAARNSAIGLRISGNMQDAFSSFQSAEAGALGVLLLTDTAADPFNGSDTLTPFASFSSSGTHPLRNLNDSSSSVDVDVFFRNAGLACPRSSAPSTLGLLECDYYRVESEHAVAQKARSKVNMGVVKTVIGSGVR